MQAVTRATPSGNPLVADSSAANYAGPLAEWALRQLVNRIDCFGAYFVQNGEVKPTTRHARLTIPVLRRHFEATSARDIVGLHTTAVDDKSRWFCVDIDAHSEMTNPSANERYAIALWFRLVDLGFHPGLFQSDGRGGFHMYVWFDRRVPTASVVRFGRWLLREHRSAGVQAEFFPKQESIAGRYGNWVRLPGRHPRREHRHRAWSGESWLDVPGTVNFLLSVEGDDPAVVLEPRFQITNRLNKENAQNFVQGQRLKVSQRTLDAIQSGADVGERNCRLFTAACDMHGAGYTDSEIKEYVSPAMLNSGLDPREIDRTIASACTKPRTPVLRPIWKSTTLSDRTRVHWTRRPWRKVHSA